MAKIMSNYIARLLMEQGLMTEEQFNNCTRVVLDAPASGLPQLYIVLTCDEELMSKLAPIMKPLLEQTKQDIPAAVSMTVDQFNDFTAKHNIEWKEK